jgi:hypothetical protein
MFALEHIRVDFFLGHDLPELLAFFLPPGQDGHE